ncbi:hypothetical protein ABW20_dc0109401 [Dactylellina cionopaga]|nr:hypothetical protein ABW20_dc0109401 [Dactylellina cionopaga]
MAEKAHCFYCFDVLSNSFSKKPPFSLSEIEEACHELEALNCSLTNGHGGTNGTATNGNSTNGNLTNGNSTNGHSSTNGVSKPARPLFVTWNLVKPRGKQLRGCIGTFSDLELEEGLKTYALTAVSILTDFEPASHALDWILGTHGLRISFTYHNRRLGATYLPNVPVEQEWTQEETLVSLMRKAGWGGKTADWQKVNLQVTRYKGTKASVSWDEYKELKEFWEKKK